MTPVTTKYDPLIYGKSDIERIVSIEADDGFVRLFIEDTDGEITYKDMPHKYWVVSEEPIRGGIELEGNLPYKYGKQFNTREEFVKNRRFIRDSYSIYNPKESCMVKDGYTYFKGMNHKEVSILSFDIESTSLEMDRTANVLLIANTFRKAGKTTRKMFCYSNYKDQGEMIQAWCKWVREVDPSIICGHNIFCYDIPYLNYIANKFGVKLELGRDESPLWFERYESKFRKDAGMFYHYNKSHIYGRELVDTMFLAVRYDIGRKYNSYGLKSIIKEEGLDVEGRVYYDASKIRDNYKDPFEWEKIKQYAMYDGDEALQLYDLMSAPFFYLTQSVPKPYQLMLESASGSQINSVMVRSYLQNRHSLPKASEKYSFEGAISFGNPGIYRNVFKVDVASLYPSIMLSYNICDPDKDPNNNFTRLVKAFTEQRLKHKKLSKETGNSYYEHRQQAEKIFINSCYGFLGATGLLFNYPEGASQVTKKGREILQTALDWAESLLFRIVNADTDSISFTKEDFSSFGKDEQDKLLMDLNSLYPDGISWEHDGIFDTLVVIKAKNYILYNEGKIKKKGSALLASTKEKALREFIDEVIDTIINKKETFKDIYIRYVKEIMDIKDISRWTTRKTISSNVINGTRANETKILDALEGVSYQEGDRVYMFFKEDKTLCLQEQYNGDYNKDVMLKKLFETGKVFQTVLDTAELFPNYALKRNKKLLEVL